VIPLFLLPYIVLPYMGNNGAFADGFGRTIAENFFWSGYGTNASDYESYWRVVGLILAWPLFLWNVFTPAPMWGWLIVSLIQTFVIIPLIVWKWGKGAYCGWLCSCGALAETMGDAHRHKMPHGPGWNRVNMVGQVVLVLALVLLALRVWSWGDPNGDVAGVYTWMLESGSILGVQTNYKWIVDVFLAGIIGVGFYFWYSGRVWCRFACPLAALMHLYARFSKFRIFAEKKKCISCNVCTSVCHQGIDIMNFANKGIPMSDPECVRCSACVQSCPTGVLSFGELRKDASGALVPKLDNLPASLVQLAEMRK
jgi:polyferredoxin